MHGIPRHSLGYTAVCWVRTTRLRGRLLRCCAEEAISSSSCCLTVVLVGREVETIGDNRRQPACYPGTISPDQPMDATSSGELHTTVRVCCVCRLCLQASFDDTIMRCEVSKSQSHSAESSQQFSCRSPSRIPKIRRNERHWRESGRESGPRHTCARMTRGERSKKAARTRNLHPGQHRRGMVVNFSLRLSVFGAGLKQLPLSHPWKTDNLLQRRLCLPFARQSSWNILYRVFTNTLSLFAHSFDSSDLLALRTGYK